MIIKLKFHEKVRVLVKEEFGERVYQEQIKNLIDLDEGTTIVFPDTVEKMSMSFIKGLTKEITNKKSMKEITEGLSFSCRDEALVEKIWNVAF